MADYVSLGQIRPEWCGFPEGYLMAYDKYNGMTLFFFLESPEPDVLRQIQDGSAFEVSLADIDGVGFFSIRFGSLPLGDCAFAPSLFHPPAPIPRPTGGLGTPLQVIVVDVLSGEIVMLRTIRLGVEFSEKFTNWFTNRMNLPLTRQQYQQIVQNTYARCDTGRLRELASIHWKFPGT